MWRLRLPLARLLLAIGLFLMHVCLPAVVWANPYFFISGDSQAVQNTAQTWSVYLYTDSSTVTAAQTVVTFNTTYFTKSLVSTVSSRCNFWAPADPSLGYGNTVTPYFYSTNRVVISCGFSNPGYTSSSSAGDLIARFTLTPEASGASTFSFSNTLVRYIGTTISPSTSPTYDVTVFESSEAAAAATPTPTPTASSSGSSSSGSTASGSATTLTSDDLNFVEIGTSGVSSTTGSGNETALTAVDQDDTIPGPPNLSPRPKATPFVYKKGSESTPEEEGEVLSVQSLRELLIPGKSQADRTVVLVNLISTLTFLALLGIVIWRLITTSRMNRLKYRHLADMLSSELSVLESKLGAIDGGKALDSVKSDFDTALEKLTGEKPAEGGK